MMRFEKSPAHDKILAATRQTLSAFGATALRADDREFHEDLYYNILTYAFGCRFGIGVFERITSEYFNPNVSLEVGLMMGLRKPVCLLKDKTLTSLHADMVGKLYRPFDPQDPGGSIPDALTGWLKDKGIIAQSPPA